MRKMDRIGMEFPDPRSALRISRASMASSSSSDSTSSLPSLPREVYYDTPWNRMTSKEKQRTILTRTGQFFALLTLLYAFLVGLELMSGSMKVLTGGVASSAFDLIDNPIAGLMVGLFATVLVQSSSTSTSIIVGLVGANALDVRHAIPVIMGANIGTSITNTFVSLAHINRLDEFERAFSGACVHDMFNILAVLVLLPVELGTHILERLTDTLITAVTGGSTADFEGPIKLLVAPLTEIFLVVDKKKLEDLSNPVTRPDVTGSLIKGGVFHGTNVSDTVASGILLAASLLVLCGALVFLVKLLSSALKGSAGKLLARALGMNGYLAMLIGAGVTIAVQSSSITTATLVPLVGLGVITLEKMYPLTLGANVGTTCTALLASLTQDTPNALQIAFCHLFFNVFAIVLFYPLPFLRRIPIALAKQLGKEVKARRYLAGVYVLVVFFAIPGALLGLSSAGIPWLIGGGLAIVIGMVAFFLYVWISRNRPDLLPKRWQNKSKSASYSSSSNEGDFSTQLIINTKESAE